MSEAGPSGSKDALGREIQETVTVRWADILDSDTNSESRLSEGTGSAGSGDDEGDEEEEEEEEEEEDEEEGDSKGVSKEEDIVKYSKNVVFDLELKEPSCGCYSPKDIPSALELLECMINVNITQSSFPCTLDNCVRCLNLIFKEKMDVAISPEKVAATDYFFRFRHEALFKCLCLAYNLPAVKSDRKFSEFGVVVDKDKDRTPDLIIEMGDTLVIIEVTAVSSFERAAQSKGIEIAGFESKYKKEMDKLDEMNVKNLYIPILFNMSDYDEPLSRSLLKPMDDLFIKNINYSNALRVMAKSLCLLTNDFKKYFITSSAILFNDGVEIVDSHPSHEFLYKKSNKEKKYNKYKSYTVSSNVYNKVNNNWDRLSYIMENSMVEVGRKSQFYLSTNSRRITFEGSSQGLTTIEWLKIIEDQNKFEFFKHLKLKIGSKSMMATDSESGLVFYDKSEDFSTDSVFEDMNLVVDHPCQQYLSPHKDLSKYQKKCNIYHSCNYESIHYDKDYEETLVKAIIANDGLNKLEGSDSSYKLGEKNDFLGSLEARKLDIQETMNTVEEVYLLANAESNVPLKLFKMKQPFLLPIADLNGKSYCSLDEKNEGLMLSMAEFIQSSNPYTHKIIMNILDSKFELYIKPSNPSNDLKSLYDLRSETSSKINLLQRDLRRIDPKEKISRTNLPDFRDKYQELKTSFKNVNRSIGNLEKVEKVKNITNFVRLPTKSKNTDLRKFYEKEMLHFRSKKVQSTMEGVGIRGDLASDYESDHEIYRNICDFLVEDKGENPDILADLTEVEDSKLLADLKTMAKNDYKCLLQDVTRSSLGHAAAMISRMSHSLMFYSQMPFSSDYVKVDNLGYKNVLLFVKGGKKIFKSRSSKMYRLLFPVPDCVLPWYIKGRENKGSMIFFKHKETNYALTPWSLLHESILTDSISFYPRVCSFAVLNSNPTLKFNEQFGRISINIMLSFHNRRQTEVLLANLRYILLSTLGDYTGVDLILNEFFSFNYDCFQAYIRGCVLFRYPEYFNTLMGLKNEKGMTGKDISVSDFNSSQVRNLFTKDFINGQDDLALMIYSTFLMTKAPYQRSIERSSNLKGIIKIHDLYEQTIGLESSPEVQLEKISVTCDNDLATYSDRLFSNDFNIDPKYCALVGNFINSILVNQGDKEDIQNKWIKIINGTWDDMATSTGLRGDYNVLEDFWGQKGYFVIYKHLFTTPNYARTAMELFNSDISDDTKRKSLRNLNKSFLEEGTGVEQEFLIFHAVDKVQWRGGREIYVMDMATKTLQQPIEKFMAELCKKLDNELISIPSDRRAQVIHHSIFEKDLPIKDTLTWYLTLDCTKWAPKSVFSKFAIMLLNMPCVPSSFVTHFLNYIEKLYKKRIYFNTSEVEVLKNNLVYKVIVDKYLKKDEKLNGYYLNMPYSWVMGIFNYTSSFLHAANQKYFSYLVLKTSIMSYKEETSLIMFAHSDDSGGRLTAPTEKLACRALILYELNLKACNHLLSKKKSVVSRIYFEILSVIYLFKQLLALLPKFLGGLRFLPTDKGPAQDMLQSYSKCIEVMVAGANFSVAYLVMKLFSTMIWRFYANKPITVLDYQRPVQYFGMPDAHPLMVLLCGSDSDLLRLMSDKSNLKSLMAFCKTVMDCNWEEGPIKPLKFEIKVRGIKKGFEDYLEYFEGVLNKWSVRNVNYHNTVMNSMSFLRKLNDAGFVGSLVNESVTRRVSRSYFLRSGYSLITKIGNIKFKDYLDSVLLLQIMNKKTDDVDIDKVLEHTMGELNYKEMLKEHSNKVLEQDAQYRILEKTLQSPIRLCKYMDVLGMENRKLIEVHRTLKPTMVQLVKTAQVFSVNFDPATLVSYIKEPDLRWALKDLRGLMTAEYELEGFCNKMGLNMNETEPDNLLRICRTYGKDNVKSIYLYSRVPTDLRQIKSYSAFLTFLAVNSFSNKEIQGLVLKLQNKELGKEYLESNINPDMYFINNCISLISVLIEKCEVSFVRDLSLKKIEEINWHGGSILEFVYFLKDWELKDLHFTIIKPQVEFLLYKLDDRFRDCSVLKGGSFYTFLKSQKVKNGWYGKGEVYITVSGDFFSIQLEGTQISSVQSNFRGKLTDLCQSYITDILINLGIDLGSLRLSKTKPKNVNSNCFGYDNLGRMCLLPTRECESGVPSFFSLKKGGFVDNLESYNFQSMYKDHLIIETTRDDTIARDKIYFLPLKKAEIVPIIPRVLDKAQFSLKLETMGLNDFEDFIMTEIMTEYGSGLYIGFEEMIDNYSSSKLYSILKETKQRDLSVLPKIIEPKTLPAQEGSLIRILIDYSEKTGNRVVSIPSVLNPVIMQLRSEYPESMSLILSEKLIEYHRIIYSPEELKEISDHYAKFSESGDLEEVRNSLIKLMTHWGYGGLVNSLENFTLSRENKNYAYFDGKIWEERYRVHYNQVFLSLINSIIESINHFAPQMIDLNLVVPALKLKELTVETVINEFVKCCCLELYNYRCLSTSTSIQVVNFNNLLLTMMASEEFCAVLQDKMSRNYILGSIPVNPRNRTNLLLLINNLRVCWSRNNKINHSLDFTKQLERLPHNITNPRSLMAAFQHTIPTKQVYYHGSVPQKLLNDLMTPKEFTYSGEIYRVEFQLTKIPSVKVPLNPVVHFERPLKNSVFDTEDWEELSCELDVEDLDVDTIIEYWENIKSPYKKSLSKRYRVRGQFINRIIINILIDVQGSSRPPKYSYYRQAGENLMILSHSYSSGFIEKFKNTSVRVASNVDTPPIFIYTSLSDKLNNIDFLNRVCPGAEFSYNKELNDILNVNMVRDTDGEIKRTVDCGFKFDEKFKQEREVIIDDKGVVRIALLKETEESKMSRPVTEASQYEEINVLIEKLRSRGLSDESIEVMKNKYFERAIKAGLSLEIILQSLLNEGEMTILLDSIKQGTLQLTPDSSIKTFLSPPSFGGIVGRSKTGNKTIRDSGVKAEIESLFSGLSDEIGSCNVQISKKLLKVVKTNYKMWLIVLKNTSFKKENKNFLLSLFLTVINNSNVSDREDNDSQWQTLINKCSDYMIQDNTDEESGDELFESLFNVIPASRLKYKAGMF